MRVRFVQPLIPAYRVPFYRALARSGVDLEVWADLAPRADLGKPQLPVIQQNFVLL